jgi:hypothetical protein
MTMTPPPPPQILEIVQDEEINAAVGTRIAKCHERGSEIAGWVGSSLILTAYIGTFPDMTEFWLNIIGSAGLLLICWRKRAYQPMFLNSAWIVGSIYNLKS